MQKDKQMTHWLNRAKSFLPKVLPQSFVFPDLICTVYMKEDGGSYCTVRAHTHTHTPKHTHTHTNTSPPPSYTPSFIIYGMQCCLQLHFFSFGFKHTEIFIPYLTTRQR